MPDQDNRRNPFDVFNTSRVSYTNSKEIHELSVVKIRRQHKCHCALPYVEDFQKVYLDYSNYTQQKVWEIIGGNVGNYYGINGPDGLQNSCAARISYGLNKSGKLIPEHPHADMNFSKKERYIVSAQRMNQYFKKIAGKPDYIVKTIDDFEKLKSSLDRTLGFIISDSFHIGFVSHSYQKESFHGNSPADIWFLPSIHCNCG